MGMPNRNNKLLALRVLPVLIAAAYTSGAVAQEKIEEVVVTAQKRQEKLQDVPLSISAISGAQLETRGIEGAKDLNSLAPNVTIKTSGTGTNLSAAASIRGTNSGQPGIWADPAVGIYVDGVFVGKNQGALFDIVDLDRVEVLRGPQGTLFGRNADGGAINLITRKPSGEFSGNVGVDIGNFNRQVERVSMDLPKMGIARVSFALRNEKRDGTVDNPNGAKWDSRDRQAERIAVGFDFTPDFKLDYAYDHSHINETLGAVSLIDRTGYGKLYTAGAATYNFFQAGLGAQLAPFVQAGYPSSVAGDPNKQYYNKLDVDGHSVTASYQINPTNSFKYIGAYRKMRYQDSTDLDGSPAPVFNAGKDTNYKSTSHEFQWIGNTQSMNYVLGAYLMNDDATTLTYQSGAFYTFTPNVVRYQQPWYQLKADARAIFGQVDYKLTDALTATAGLRFTRETKKADLWRTNTNANFDPPGSPGVTYQAGFAPQGAETSFSSTTPVLALAYKVNEGLNVYGRVAKGFRSGGFPLEAPIVASNNTGPLVPYKPQTSTTYEGGVKTTFLGGKAQLNAAVFQNNITDWQVSLLPPGGTTPTMVNAGKVESKGLELEGILQIADGWRVQGSYGYLQMNVKSYMANNQYGAVVDIASNSVTGYAPKQQLALTLDGRLAKTSWGTLRGIIDYVSTSEYYNYSGQLTAIGTNVGVGPSADESKIPALALVNARLLLAGIPIGGPGKADASLWVRNAANVHKEVAHIDVGGFYRIAAWNEPRTFGLSLNYKW